MALSPIERLKALKELRAAQALNKDASSPIARLKAIKAVRAARQKLGIGLAKPAPAPAPQLDQYEGLQKIAGGAFDHQGLHEVMRLIQTAINGLGGAEKLDAQGKEFAHKAINHWMQLEAA